MIRMIAMLLVTSLTAGCGLFGIGGDDDIEETCNEPQPYQDERLNDPVEAPDGLDQLDVFREMPIPKAQTPSRPEDAGCITTPPSIRSE